MVAERGSDPRTSGLWVHSGDEIKEEEAREESSVSTIVVNKVCCYF